MNITENINSSKMNHNIVSLKNKTNKSKVRQCIRCCVPGCDRIKRSFPNLYFYSLPENKVIAQQWLDRINDAELVNNPLANIKVCARHFEKKDFLDRRRRKLEQNAIPVLFMPIPSPETTISGTFYVVHNSLSTKLYTKPVNVNTTCTAEEDSLKQTQVTADASDTTWNSFASVLHDFKKICRICLRSSENLTNIYCDFIQKMLISCPTLKFTDNHTYPEQICAACLSELKIVCNFSRKYEKSNIVLQKYVDKRKKSALHTYSEQMEFNYVPEETERTRNTNRNFDYLLASAELQTSNNKQLGSNVAATGQNTSDRKNNYAIENSTQTASKKKTTNIVNNSDRNNAFITENKSTNDQNPTAQDTSCKEQNYARKNSAIDNNRKYSIASPRKMTKTCNNNFTCFQRGSRKRKLNENKELPVSVCHSRPCVAVVPMQKSKKSLKLLDEKKTLVQKNGTMLNEDEQPDNRECSKTTVNNSNTVEDNSRIVLDSFSKNIADTLKTFEENSKIPENITDSVEINVDNSTIIEKKSRTLVGKSRALNRGRNLGVRKKITKNNPGKTITESETNNNNLTELNNIIKPESLQIFNKPADIDPSKRNTNTNNTNNSPTKLNRTTDLEEIVLPNSNTSCLVKKRDLFDKNIGCCTLNLKENSTEMSNSMGKEQNKIEKIVANQCNTANINITNLHIDKDELNRFLSVRVDLSKSKLEYNEKVNLTASTSENNCKNSKVILQELAENKSSCKTVKFSESATNYVLNPEQTNSSAAIKPCNIQKLNESPFHAVQCKDEKLNIDHSHVESSMNNFCEIPEPMNSTADIRQNKSDRNNLNNSTEDLNNTSVSVLPSTNKLNEKANSNSKLVEDIKVNENSEIFTDLNCELIQDQSEMTSMPILESKSLENTDTVTCSNVNKVVLAENKTKTDTILEDKENTMQNDASTEFDVDESTELIQRLNEFTIISRQSTEQSVVPTTLQPSDTDTNVPTTENLILLDATTSLLQQQANNPFVYSDAMFSSGQDLFNESLPLSTTSVTTVQHEISLNDSFMQTIDNIINLESSQMYGEQFIGSQVELSTENDEIRVDDVMLPTETNIQIVNYPVQCEFVANETKLFTSITDEHRYVRATEPINYQLGRENIPKLEDNTQCSATNVTASLSAEQNVNLEHFSSQVDVDYAEAWLPTEHTNNLVNTSRNKFENCKIHVQIIKQAHSLAPSEISRPCTIVSGDFADQFSTELLDDTVTSNLQYDTSTMNGSVDDNFDFTDENTEETATECISPQTNNNSGSDSVHSYIIYGKSNVSETDQHIGTVTCTFCRQTVEIDSYETHLNQHTNEETFCCEFCGEIFSDLNGFNIHRDSHIWSRTYDCGECDKQYASLYQLEKHLTVHEEQKPAVCQLCCKVFRERALMVKHVIAKTCQKNKAKYQCPMCKKQFERENMCRRHVNIHVKYECPLCKESFCNSKLLRKHFSSHGNFTCWECKKVFQDKLTYRNHLKNHTKLGEQPTVAKCDMCHPNQAAEDIHLSDNANIKLTHKCVKCNCRFLTLRKLNVHSARYCGI